MHATLLYTKRRVFCSSETFRQVCPVFFKNCKYPVVIEKIYNQYHSIIKPIWKFKIEEIKLYKSKNNVVFSAVLSFKNYKNIYFNKKTVSAGLHLTLIQCFDPFIWSESTIEACLRALNQCFKGKLIKIANKNGVADLEFGISG